VIGQPFQLSSFILSPRPPARQHKLGNGPRTHRLNNKVSDRSQPPMTVDSSLSESAGSRSLARQVGRPALAV
jgi:hypothetical protein